MGKSYSSVEMQSVYSAAASTKFWFIFLSLSLIFISLYKSRSEVRFGLVSLFEWHINLCRLFDAKAIRYYLTHSWEDKGVHTFPKSICPKVNVIARLEYELAYYDSAVHRFNHYTTRTPLGNFVADVLDCDIIVIEFELPCYFYFWTHIFRKSMNSIIPDRTTGILFNPSLRIVMGYIVSPLFCQDDFSIK